MNSVEKLIQLAENVNVDVNHGIMDYSNSEIKNFLKEASDIDSTIWDADNLVGWLYRALVFQVKARGRYKKIALVKNIVKNILIAIDSGKLTDVKFTRDSSNMLIGIANINYKDYQ